jgi:hypothetical protein
VPVEEPSTASKADIPRRSNNAYSIILSARADKEDGTSIPSAFAVFSD